MPQYTLTWPSSDLTHAAITVQQDDGAGTFADYSTGKAEDIFDLSLYGIGSTQESYLASPEYRESVAAVEVMVELANRGLAGLASPQFTEDEIALLVEALDSHEYWQLSETHERNNGYSTVEDGENPEIDAVRALIQKLERV